MSACNLGAPYGSGGQMLRNTMRDILVGVCTALRDYCCTTLTSLVLLCEIKAHGAMVLHSCEQQCDGIAIAHLVLERTILLDCQQVFCRVPSCHEVKCPATRNPLLTFSFLIGEDFWPFLAFPSHRSIFSTVVEGGKNTAITEKRKENPEILTN